jgi:hypothetical protein
MRNIKQDFYNLTNFLNNNMLSEFEYYLQKLLSFTTGRHDINNIYKVENEVEINDKGEVINIPPLICNSILQNKYDFFQTLLIYGHPKNLKFSFYTEKSLLQFFIDHLTDDESFLVEIFFTPNEIEYAVEIFDDNPKKFISHNAITYAKKNNKHKIALVLEKYLKE